MNTPPTPVESILEQIAVRERSGRKRAILYTLVPILIAAALVIWTGQYLAKARMEVQEAQREVERLQQERQAVDRQVATAAETFVSIATVTRQIERIVESKESYLRSIDEARFLIDLRMKFDALNKELRQLSSSFPAVASLTENRNWVVVVKSSRDLASLKQSAQEWIARHGAANIGIYRTPNGFYGLVVRRDGSFTQAYRLTVSFIESGQARDAYFAETTKWGEDLLE